MVKLLLSHKTFELDIEGKVVFHRGIIVYDNLYRNKFIVLFFIYLFSLYRQELKTQRK